MRKHGVRADEVQELFSATPVFWFLEKGRRRGEDLYAAANRLSNGRSLIAFFIHKRSREALVLSAREMTRAERSRYETTQKH